MAESSTVLVIGGTRGTGLLAASYLLEKGHRVRALARNATRAKQVLGSRAEVVKGDVTRAESLPPALEGIEQIIYTAGVTHRPAGEAIVKATVYDGVQNTIAAARATGFQGRFVLMGALGTTRGSPLSLGLNLIKGNTLRWRHRAEDALRRSGLDYTIVHAGILTDAPRGQHAVEIGQAHRRMWPWTRIGRADAAEVLVRSLSHPSARNTTFDAIWSRERLAWDEMFRALRSDSCAADQDPAAVARH